MRPTILAAAVAAICALAACGTDDDPTTAAPSAAGQPSPRAASATEVAVVATDHSFAMPARIGAGLVTFSLDNQGQHVHHAQLVRLNPGASLDAATAAARGGDWEALARHTVVAGGVGIVTPGARAAATLALSPGTYLLFCGIPDGEGVPHATHGMVQAFTVTDDTGAGAATAPATVGQVTLTEFAFELPADLDGTVAVTNAGGQEHEMLLFQMAPGASLEAVLGSLFSPPAEGPPPGLPAGGVQALAPGQTAYLALGSLDPGTYALACFIPDPDTGTPHLELGMVGQFTIG